VEHQLDVGERLQARAESRLRLADTLGDGADTPAVEGVQVQHPVGLPEPKRAEDDSFGPVLASGHAFESIGGGGGTFARVSALDTSMARVRLYSTRWCGYCVRAKGLLESRGIEYEEVMLDDDPAFRQKLFDLTGGWTVPQILIDGRPIGGYTELWRLDREGKLAPSP
jgi:glutaredoxin 3